MRTAPVFLVLYTLHSHLGTLEIPRRRMMLSIEIFNFIYLISICKCTDKNHLFITSTKKSKNSKLFDQENYAKNREEFISLPVGPLIPRE